MDTRIPQLPDAPGAIDTATSYIEVSVPDVSSPTGFTSVKTFIDGISPAPIVIGVKEVAWGDALGGITSTGNFKYDNGRVYVQGLNQASGDMTIETIDSVGLPMFKVQNNGRVGIGTASPTARAHILQNTVSTGAKGISVNFATIGEVFSIDDNADVQFTTNLGATVRGTNGIVNLISNGGLNPYITFKYSNGGGTSGTLSGDQTNMFLYATNNFGIGTSYFNAQAKIHVKGVDATSSNYNAKLESSAGTPIMYVRNDGYVSINQTTVGAAKLEITGGADQGVYVQSNSIGVNGSGTANGAIGVNANVASGYAGTSLYVRGNHASNVLIDVVNSSTSSIARMLDSGFFGIGNSSPSHLISAYHTKSATAQTTGIDAINLGGHYSSVAGQYPKVILYDDGGSIAGIGVSGGQIDYIGYNTSVNHVFWAGATKRVTLGGDGYNGFNVAVPLGIIHAKGADTGAVNHTFKYEDSAGINILKARNDGYVIQRAIDGAISNGSLAASEMSSYIDETLNNLIIKVKYADGVTVKTATIPLV